jgi:hypothetical protein
MIRIMMFSNSTGSFVTNFMVKGANSTKWIVRGPPANGRPLRPVVVAAENRSKSGSLLVGACEWPSHQQVWACL